MQINKINCRICGDKNLKIIYFKKEIPFTDEFRKKLKQKYFLGDLCITQCKSCRIIQNPINVNYSRYYKDYNYTVGYSNLMNEFMNEISLQLSKEFKSKKLNILEYGSGSGEQLKAFQMIGHDVLGVEPSKYLANFANKSGVKTINEMFDMEILKKVKTKFDVILSSYTFDHLSDPLNALKISSKLLNKNGILTIEVHDFDLIRKRSEFSLFEHEHTIYLNKHSAKYLMKLAGFEVIKFNIVRPKYRRANSLIIVAKKIYKPKKFISKSIPLKKNIQNKIDKTVKFIDEFIKKKSSLGKSIAGWGVGGRGVITLATIKNSNFISYIVDNSKICHGYLTPKSNLRIKNPAYLKNKKVDYIIVFSFGYINEIIKQCKEYGYKKNQIISLLDLSKK